MSSVLHQCDVLGVNVSSSTSNREVQHNVGMLRSKLIGMFEFSTFYVLATSNTLYITL